MRQILIILAVVFASMQTSIVAQETDNAMPKFRIKTASIIANGIGGATYNGVKFSPAGGIGQNLGVEYQFFKGFIADLVFSYQYSGSQSYVNGALVQKLKFSHKAFELNLQYRFTLNKTKKNKSHLRAGLGMGYYIPSTLTLQIGSEPEEYEDPDFASHYEKNTIEYKPSTGVQLSFAYELSFGNKVGITAGMRLKVVTFKATKLLTEEESIYYDLLDEVSGISSDLFLGVIYYIGK